MGKLLVAVELAGRYSVKQQEYGSVPERGMVKPHGRGAELIRRAAGP